MRRARGPASSLLVDLNHEHEVRGSLLQTSLGVGHCQGHEVEILDLDARIRKVNTMRNRVISDTSVLGHPREVDAAILMSLCTAWQ